MIHKTIKVSKNSVGKLTTYILDGERRRPAVLILPGGGYFSPLQMNRNKLQCSLPQGLSFLCVHYSVSPYRHLLRYLMRLMQCA